MELQQDLQEVAAHVWSTALELEAVEGESLADAAYDVASRIAVTGDWNGSIWLDCSAEAARDAAAIMFDLERDQAGAEELVDAVAELANMIAGSVRGLLGANTTIGLPTNTETVDSSAGASVEAVHLEANGEAIRVRVVEEPSG